MGHLAQDAKHVRDARPRTLREHLLFLNDATVQIGASPDLEETVQGLARAAVPFLADIVTVHLLEELLCAEYPGLGPRPGQEPAVATLRRMAVVLDDEAAAWRDAIPVGGTQVMQPGGPARQAMRLGRPVVLSPIGPELSRDSLAHIRPEILRSSSAAAP